MKYLFALLLFLPSALIAQESDIFTIDSLPTEGVLLDYGWKWHAGDNPEWAKADFVDKDWASINPTLLFQEIPQVQEAGISWFRLEIDVDSSLVNVPLLNALDLTGAVEIYLNGQLLQQIGIVSKDPSVEKAYKTAFSRAANFIFPQKGKNVLAIRYSFTRSNIFFPAYQWTRWAPIYCTIRPLEGFIPMQFADFDDQIMNSIPWLGLFLALTIIHFAFNFFLPAQKHNLLFGLGILCYTGYIWLKYLLLSDMTVSVATLLVLIWQPLAYVFQLFLIAGAYSYLKKPIKKQYWLLPFGYILLFACQFLNSSWAMPLYLCLFPITTLYYVLVIRKSIQEGRADVKILYYTGLIALFADTIFTILQLNLFNWDIFGNTWLFSLYKLSFNIFRLSLPMGVLLPLARDFASTNLLLVNKSKEVLQLSTEKHRIATDMHDDIGSDLSALNMRAERIRQKVTGDKKTMLELDNLVESSRDIAKKVREVIWTINARHDTLSSIVHYFDLYAEDFFEPTDIVVRTAIPSNIPDVVINGESRKVLFMCFKETLNNVIKHAKASELKIAFTTENHLLTIIVQDDGVGFDPVLLTNGTADGNGLLNLQERMTEIGGKCAIQTSKKGTLVVFTLRIAGLDRE